MEYAGYLESINNLADARKAYEEIAELFKGTSYAATAELKAEELRAKASQGGSSREPSESYRKGKVKY